MNEAQLDPDAIGNRLKKLFGSTPAASVEAGVTMDDCAAINIKAGTLVLTSDFVNSSPIGLELGISSPEDLGYYLVASNISDLAGSGAKPLGLLLNIMWGRNEPASEFWRVMEGVSEASCLYGAPVLGGDTKLTSGAPILNATAIGTAGSSSSLFLQARAKIGDNIWVSGKIGSCAAALLGLHSGIADDGWRTWAEDAIRRPVVPLERSQQIAALQLEAAGVDISDGLCGDLARLAEQSQVGVRVVVEDIPVEPELNLIADEMGVHRGSFSLTIGGDLQFAVTARPEVDLARFGMICIGNVEQGKSCLELDGRAYEMPELGHRDAHGMNFADEAAFLMRRLPFNDHA